MSRRVGVPLLVALASAACTQSGESVDNGRAERASLARAPNRLGSSALGREFGSGNLGGNLATPQRPLLLVLSKFDAGPPLHPAVFYDRLVFGRLAAGYTNELNVRDYFTEMSNGKFTFSRGGLVDVTDTPLTAAEAGDPIGSALARALDKLTATELRAFDADRDGAISNEELTVLVVENGSMGAATRGFGCRTKSSPVETAPPVCGSGAWIDWDTDIASIAHELSHTLGAIDMYGPSSVGAASLMAETLSGNDNRAVWHLDAWHKLQLGWYTPRVHVSTDDSWSEVLQVPSGPAGTREREAVIIYDASRGPKEFFLLELRQQTGYDANGGGSGVVIWHAEHDANRTVTNGAAAFSPNGYYGSENQLSIRIETGELPNGVKYWPADSSSISLNWNNGDVTRFDLSISPGPGSNVTIRPQVHVGAGRSSFPTTGL